MVWLDQKTGKLHVSSHPVAVGYTEEFYTDGQSRFNYEFRPWVAGAAPGGIIVVSGIARTKAYSASCPRALVVDPKLRKAEVNESTSERNNNKHSISLVAGAGIFRDAGWTFPDEVKPDDTVQMTVEMEE
jgi:hypothetical protein